MGVEHDDFTMAVSMFGQYVFIIFSFDLARFVSFFLLLETFVSLT